MYLLNNATCPCGFVTDCIFQIALHVPVDLLLLLPRDDTRWMHRIWVQDAVSGISSVQQNCPDILRARGTLSGTQALTQTTVFHKRDTAAETWITCSNSHLACECKIHKLHLRYIRINIIGGRCHRYFCRNKTHLSRQKYACHDKTFVVTKLCLSWQNFVTKLVCGKYLQQQT